MTAIDFPGRSCINCDWLLKSGPHIGCWYGGKYHAWLIRAHALAIPCCEDKMRYEYLAKDGCQWKAIPPAPIREGKPEPLSPGADDGRLHL